MFWQTASDCSSIDVFNLEINSWSFITNEEANCCKGIDEMVMKSIRIIDWWLIDYLFVLLSLWLFEGLVDPVLDLELVAGEGLEVLESRMGG